MNWFTGKKMTTNVSVLAVSVDDMPMDCCDESRVHVWLYCMAWSVRRAFQVGGDEFLRVFARSGGMTDERLDELFASEGNRTHFLRAYAQAMVGEHFYVEMIGPPAEAEPGEHIEITDIQLCPPIEEVMARLGIEP